MLPAETYAAFEPPRERAGLARLRAPTVGDAARLAAAGVDPLEPSAAQLEVAARLLGGWRARLLATGRARRAAAARACACARAATVPGATDGERTVFTPTGLGWPLELAEALMAEYGISFDEAARIPLCRAFALAACVRQRHGGRHAGPDYWERATMRAKKRMKRED